MLSSSAGGRACGPLTRVRRTPGAAAARESQATRQYLGLALLPQAGVAIGLILVLQDTPQFTHLPYMGQMVNIVLASILVNEIVGPPLSKYALEASGSARRPSSMAPGATRSGAS